MTTLAAVSIAVIAGIMVVVLMVLIPVLFQVRRTAKEAERLIDLVRIQVAPVSRDIGLVSRDVRSIVQSIHRQVDRVEDGIETVHDMAVGVRSFQLEVQRRIEEPLLQVAAVLGGIKKGIEAFARVFGRS